MNKLRLDGNAYVVLICITAGMGGFLFGFDTAVISGAINFLRAQFSLSPAMEGWLMSAALLGCVLGAGVAGYLSDRYGRKKILVSSALLFIVSAIGCAMAETPSGLVIARIVGGIGVGFAAMVAPLFISELSPARLRGRLVALYQLAIAVGILCSYLSNGWLLHYAGSHVTQAPSAFMHYYMVTEVWRGMLGSNGIPALLFLIFLFFVPESPRWLVKAGRGQEARLILDRVNGRERGDQELKEIKSALLTEAGSFRQLLEPGLRIALIIGIVLPFVSQLTGITTVMYYAPAIFEQAGFQTSSAIGSAAVIGLFNTAFTFVAIWKIDKWGRKPLLIWGFTGLSIALAFIGWEFSRHTTQSSFLLGGFIFYIAVFSATIGPGVWVVLAEIYPTAVRGRAMSVGTLSLFMGSTFVTQTYPLLRESVGMDVTFLLYAVMMLPAAWLVKKLVPETKGKTLEEIEQHWKAAAPQPKVEAVLPS